MTGGFTNLGFSSRRPWHPPKKASLAAVEKYRSNLRLWKSRASLAVEPLPEVFKDTKHRK